MWVGSLQEPFADEHSVIQNVVVGASFCAFGHDVHPEDFPGSPDVANSGGFADAHCAGQLIQAWLMLCDVAQGGQQRHKQALGVFAGRLSPLRCWLIRTSTLSRR